MIIKEGFLRAQSEDPQPQATSLQPGLSPNRNLSWFALGQVRGYPPCLVPLSSLETPLESDMNSTQMKRILIVDDEVDVTDLLTYHLRARGYDAQAINNPIEIMDHARSFAPDLVILDVMMPDLNGIQICRMLRADRALKRVPIIFLSAKTEEGDRIEGLEVGGDDYICKPFSPKELVLRVQSIFRRVAGDGESQVKPLQVGGVLIDSELHEVKVNGQSIALTATEFRLLKTLMEKKGRVQPRDQLLLKVWKYETDIETRTVDTHIRRLREKLGPEAGLIETIRGVGYRMIDPPLEVCTT